MTQSSKPAWTYKPGMDGKADTVTVYIDGQPHIRTSGDKTFKAVMEALKSGIVDSLRLVLTPKKAMLSTLDGRFQLFDNELLWDGNPVGDNMFQRILAVFNTGLGMNPIVNFFKNANENPDKTARDEAYLFLEHNNLPITDDGHILAYKVIRNNWKDCHTGTMDNSVGATPELDRATCDPSRHNTCSRGLHFCSRSYIGDGISISDYRRLVVVKVNPRDITAIPSDYNNAKGRACKYLILEEIKFSEHLPDDYVSGSPSAYNPDAEDDGIVINAAVNAALAADAVAAAQPVNEEEVEAEAGKVTDEMVRNIRKACADPAFTTLTQVGKAFGLHRSTVQRIRDKKSHGHVI